MKNKHFHQYLGILQEEKFTGIHWNDLLCVILEKVYHWKNYLAHFKLIFKVY